MTTSFPRRVPRLISLLGLLGAVAATAAACGGNKTAAFHTTPVKQSSLSAGQAVPSPKGHNVLAMHGSIGSTNVGKNLEFDMKTLERMGLRSIELYEPFKKRRMTFEAIPLRTLLDVAKLNPAAANLHAVALNDYSVDLPVDVARGDGVYLATHNGDGSPISLADGGPIRIVFLDGAAGGKVQNYWIWSLGTVGVK
jgi:hypothetical protein